ncbi:MAG: SUMF1/EgtB/PvdO family nonheme iron enzyme [Bacteroidia bacterium]
MKYLHTYIGILLLCIIAPSHANNIQVSNISLTGQNTSQGFTMVEFDLAWDNSWRISVGPSNWDAAWVFVKYRKNKGEWQHAALNYVDGNNDGHNAPSGYTVKGDNQEAAVFNSGNGVYLYRSTEGSGDISLQNVQLRWNYASNGVANSDLVDVKVFAIEMVHVPQGAFQLGSPANNTLLERSKFYTYPNLSDTYTISSEAAITVGTTNGNLYYSGWGDQGSIPAQFPKGYDAFYCMKYEVSQEQWLSFFNLLTLTQKTNRDITGALRKNSDNVEARNGVSWVSGNNPATTTFPHVPMNFVSHLDMAAYLDWACLRFMTELEFTKACRGSTTALTGEYAWGGVTMNEIPYRLSNAGLASERIINPATNIGNANNRESVDSTKWGPMRCGIFAASARTQNSEETGGSYFGIMELSGNLLDVTVLVGHPDGRRYTGAHGNGIINGLGFGTVTNWPGLRGIGGRGGSYLDRVEYLCVASRNDAVNVPGIDNNIGRDYRGFRGVRTAP